MTHGRSPFPEMIDQRLLEIGDGYGTGEGKEDRRGRQPISPLGPCPTGAAETAGQPPRPDRASRDRRPGRAGRAGRGRSGCPPDPFRRDGGCPAVPAGSGRGVRVGPPSISIRPDRETARASSNRSSNRAGDSPPGRLFPPGHAEAANRSTQPQVAQGLGRAERLERAFLVRGDSQGSGYDPPRFSRVIHLRENSVHQSSVQVSRGPVA
jgi:hypothetical protein